MDRNVLNRIVFFYVMMVFNFSHGQTIVDLEGIELGILKTKIEKNTAIFMDRINSAYKTGDDSVNFKGIEATDEGIVNTDLLWSTSHFMMQEVEVYEKLLRRNNTHNGPKGYELRNMRMYFKEAEEGKRNRQGVISFDNNGNIIDIYIAIDYKLYRDVMIKGKGVEDLRHRQIILDFVESFRTAYNRKDIGFIETVFSNDALIIVGKTVKLKNIDKDFKNYSKTTYTVKGKKEYVAALKNAFRRNEYINIEFEDLKVVRHNEYQYMYGVTVKQDWNSTHYSDKGYVFLLIDLKDIDKPIIHIRTWDEKDTFNIRTFKLEDLN